MISGAPVEITDSVTKFGEKIGVAFQLADDVIDIASESNQSGKTPGTDLVRSSRAVDNSVTQ